MVCGSDVWRSHPPGRSSGGNRICSFRERLIARLRAACVEEWLWKLKEPDDQVILPTTVLISMFYFVVVQAQVRRTLNSELLSPITGNYRHASSCPQVHFLQSLSF
jgi:hypothetical protein